MSNTKNSAIKNITAALLCVAFGAMTLLMLLPAVGEYAAQIRDFLSELSLDAVYGQTMLKAMGIVLMTQFAAQVCRDMDAPSIACRAELCGRLMLLGVALASVNFLRIAFLTNYGTNVALIISLTMFCTIVIAKLIGGSLPLLAKAVHLDPALMASPLITTMVDAASLTILFTIATRIFHVGAA